jgi:hypothetical protein
MKYPGASPVCVVLVLVVARAPFGHRCGLARYAIIALEPASEVEELAAL